MHVRDRIEHVLAHFLARRRFGLAGGALAAFCFCSAMYLTFRNSARSRRMLPRQVSKSVATYTLPGGAFIFTACLRGPLRVRAFVRVR